MRILAVRFKDHALFSEEDLMCADLQTVYEEHQRREAVNLHAFYTSQIGRATTCQDRL